MSKESAFDPLLPQNDPAPEISSGEYGTVRQESRTTYTSSTPRRVINNDGDENEDEASAQPSFAQNISGMVVRILTFVVFVGIVVAFFRHRSPPRIVQPNPLHPVPGHPSPSRSIEDRVKKILLDTPLIDGHNDLAIFIRAVYHNDLEHGKFDEKFGGGGMPLQVDLPRLRKGMVGGAFWSTFVMCPENASSDFSDAEYATSVSETLEQIDLMKRLQRKYPGSFTPAGTSLERMLSQFHGTRSMFGPLSLEGLHQVPQSAPMSTLRLYYELGVRAATLTWNCHNAFADAAMITSKNTTVVAPYHRGGLTTEGRRVLKEMNRLGMIIDISHTSYWTQQAVLSNNTSRAPVIYTHSSAFSLCPHPRNVKDDTLELVKKTNALVMVNFSPDFISCVGNGDDGKTIPTFYPKNNTLHQVARHIVYIGEKIGYEHVGLGSDFDGIGLLTPKGLDGVDKYPDLVAELLRMNVSDVDAAKIVGGNLLRVWQEVESVSRAMKDEGISEELDEVNGFYGDIVLE